MARSSGCTSTKDNFKETTFGPGNATSMNLDFTSSRKIASWLSIWSYDRNQKIRLIQTKICCRRSQETTTVGKEQETEAIAHSSSTNQQKNVTSDHKHEFVLPRVQTTVWVFSRTKYFFKYTNAYLHDHSTINFTVLRIISTMYLLSKHQL